MSNNELVSVIIPVYNVESKLDRCLQSVVDQTYSGLEIILVDDGSTDRSRELCKKWCEKDQRIKLSHEKPNEGQSAARNIGMSMSSGQYILFVDSDDFIEPYTIELALNSMKAENSDICVFNFWNYDESSNTRNKACRYKPKYTFLENMLLEFFPCSVCCKLVKRSVMISGDDSIIFPEGRRYEDTTVCLKQGVKGRHVSAIDKPLYYYVYNGNSTVTKPRLKDIYDMLENCHEIRDFLAGRVSEKILEAYITSILAYALQVWYRAEDAPNELRQEILKMMNKSVKKVDLFTIFKSKNWKKRLLCKLGIFNWVISKAST